MLADPRGAADHALGLLAGSSLIPLVLLPLPKVGGASTVVGIDFAQVLHRISHVRGLFPGIDRRGPAALVLWLAHLAPVLVGPRG